MKIPEPLYDLPFDQFERYRLSAQVADGLRRRLGRPLRVLDVGGYLGGQEQTDRLPLQEFLGEDRVVVLDVKPGGMAGYVRGSGAALPVRDGSFDLVISCDTLEHIPREDRGAFVAELCRVSTGLMLLAAPQDSTLNRLAEELFLGLIQRLFHVDHEVMREHRELGLPAPEEVREILAGRDWIELPSGRIYTWLLLMVLKHWLRSIPEGRPLEARLDRMFNLDLAGADLGEPAYRRVYLVDRGAGPELLAELEATLTAASGPAPVGLEHLQLALAGLGLVRQGRLETAQEAHRLLAEQHREAIRVIAEHEATIAEAFRTIRSLEGTVSEAVEAIDSHETDLAELRSLQDRLELEATHRIERIRELERSLADRQSENARLQEEHRLAQERCQELERERDELDRRRRRLRRLFTLGLSGK